MGNKPEEEILGILNEINETDIIGEVDRIHKIDPVVEFRNTVFDFYKDRLVKISNDEILRKKVEEHLLNKIENNEASFAQLMSLSLELRSTTIASINSLLGIIRPVANADNPLLQRDLNTQEDDFNFNKTDAESISKLMRIIQALDQVKKDDTK